MNKLTYFPARGTCDQIRLLLEETNIPYQEVSVHGRDYKALQDMMPLPYLPMWEEENITIVHANAIMRHLARKTGLYGANEKENALCDMWDEQCELVLKFFWESEFMKHDYSELKQQELKDEYMEAILIPQLIQITKMMSSNPNVYLVGTQLTFVDIKLFALLDKIDKEIPLALPSFPTLQAFYEAFGNRPRIKAFCRSARRF